MRFFFLLSTPPLPSFPLLVLDPICILFRTSCSPPALYSCSVPCCLFAALGSSPSGLWWDWSTRLQGFKACSHSQRVKASLRVVWLRVLPGDSGDDRRICHRLLPDCSIVDHLNTWSKQQRKRDLPTDVLVMLFLQDCGCSCLRFYLVWASW